MLEFVELRGEADTDIVEPAARDAREASDVTHEDAFGEIVGKARGDDGVRIGPTSALLPILTPSPTLMPTPLTKPTSWLTAAMASTAILPLTSTSPPSSMVSTTIS